VLVSKGKYKKLYLNTIKILMLKGLKGIDPLVATVLLIAVTMTLAGIIAFWGSSFVRSNLPSENQTQNLQSCVGGNLKLVSQSYNSSTQTFSILILNNGQEKLFLTNITFIYEDGIDSKELGAEISPAQPFFKTLSNVREGFKSFLISTNCPNVYIQYP
jgi:flagellin-like protein